MLGLSLQQRVTSLVATTLSIPSEQVALESKIDELANDSIQLFELILVFEKEFSTEVSYESLITIETVGDIVQFIEHHPAYVAAK